MSDMFKNKPIKGINKPIKGINKTIIKGINNNIKFPSDNNINLINRVIMSFDRHILEQIRNDVDFIEIPKLGHLDKTNKGKINKLIKLKDAESINDKGRKLNDDEVRTIIDDSKLKIYNELCNRTNRLQINQSSDIVKNNLLNKFKNNKI